MKEIVENDLMLDDQSIWVCDSSKGIAYSDGARSDNYLERAFRSVQDLSSSSVELERFIRDWPSEYHLSRKRTQLLRGFTFDSSHHVLEIMIVSEVFVLLYRGVTIWPFVYRMQYFTIKGNV